MLIIYAIPIHIIKVAMSRLCRYEHIGLLLESLRVVIVCLEFVEGTSEIGRFTAAIESAETTADKYRYYILDRRTLLSLHILYSCAKDNARPKDWYTVQRVYIACAI